MTVPRSYLTRRALLRSAALSAGALAFGPGFYRRALAATPATPGPGPYGPLLPFDDNGISLPEGFTSRCIAVGEAKVPNTDYTWHRTTDGQATFPRRDAPGWILVANSESNSEGGVSSITFDGTGEIVGARRILSGTSRNCSGGPTPWGTWLSCEEHSRGRTWECDPTGQQEAVVLPALGTFRHESACVDPLAERVYLTEDEGEGCLYRFTPDDYPDLTSGLLEVAVVDGAGLVSWAPVPDPTYTGDVPTRFQVPGATQFRSGEGMWYDSGVVFFTTKGDRKVWAFNTGTSRIETIYDRETAGDGSPLQSVDNVTVASSGDVYVCEDGDNFEICIITPDRQVASFVRLDQAIHTSDNETVGVVFDPSGYRMYFGVQRSYGDGAVYEITGPFRGNAGGPPAGVDGLSEADPSDKRSSSSGGGDSAAPADGAPAPAPAPAPAASGVLAPTGEGPMTPADRIAPGVKLRTVPSVSATKLAGKGVPLTLEIDEPAGVDVRIVAQGGRTLGTRSTSVAVRGRVRLRVKARRALRRPMRGRRQSQRAELIVTVTDHAGNQRRVRKPITIRAPKRSRK